MNTLLSNLPIDAINRWKSFNNFINTLTNDESNFLIEIEGAHGSFSSVISSAYIKSVPETLIVVPTEKEEETVISDLDTFSKDIEIVRLPWWSSVPYRACSLGSVVFRKRAGALAKLASKENPSGKKRVFIMNQRSFLTPVPPPEYMNKNSFTLKKGQSIDTIKIADSLTKLGYLRVPKVSVNGEFTLRGEVLDIYLSCEEHPYRIIFDFDEIENIRTFETETQTTIESVEEITVYPSKEILWTDEDADRLYSKLNKTFKDNQRISDEYTLSMGLEKTDLDLKFEELIYKLKTSKEAEGEELLYPALFDRKYSVLDYLDEQTAVIFYDFDRLLNSKEVLQKEYTGLYKKARPVELVLSPENMIFDFDALYIKHRKNIFFKSIHTQTEENRNDDITHFNFAIDPPRSFFGNINYLKEQLANLQKENWNIYIFTNDENQNLRINEILKDFTKDEVKNKVVLIPEQISSGFAIPELKLFVIQENEIFGRKKHVPKSLSHVKSSVIDTFIDLNAGDYVVHVNYGIGIFKGIERVKAMGNERDYIKLEYAGEEYAFVPIEQVNLIQKYIGNEGNAPKIDTIGSKSWENRKNRVKKAVEDLAHKLIDLYSRRKASTGFAFPKDTEWQMAFEAAFPYEDTPDQITVTREIKDDMEKPVPMDRLVCGDVGYGKTEIAMRAAFKAVLGGKQVAFLAPTTILAEQHYETCLERFKNFPVTIAQLSRFVARKDQKKILEKLSLGEVDILIGTHRIIQNDVKFKNIGLLIIDEEQRFGVKDKEKLKVIKNNIDSLSLSATPIPRSLHMSLLKIRDMSLLTTPPQNRHPIETVIDAFDDEKVARAIRFEVERGGQVFYLHNRVETLEETRLKLEKLVPEMLIDTAHGQMTSDELDDIFRRFKMGGFHILVATTIIENGIDIPNVNTIIIDRADMYGVSQLYQLRGRVGRSDKKAYAYLFYPENKVLSEVAMKRLQVISDFTELGSGFKIAMKDMEIRGAGNLLGRDQSGDVYSVGFDMYLRLLNEAISILTMQKDYKPESEVLMEFEYTGFIPDTYVHSPQTKMEIYKKIAAVQTKEELDGIYTELLDRFGPIPEEVISLITLSEIRCICKKLNITSIKEKKGVVNVEFSKVSEIKVDKVLRLIKESANMVALDSAKPNMILLKTGNIGLKEKSEFICEKLSFLE
ncbi:MAG: transcription-repair coupling factor [Treponema sp.]|uniref:transcription-repair coupling factor n=1 Tax=Treponema sp. TaxID=166 RepID=UPI00298E1A7B|nr:transcription-repair coupling factor [Treponema sp.]MBR5934428.1 transcription-repair coupling factor [Treponema sp.]